jgi:haloalkane dehalogenase
MNTWLMVLPPGIPLPFHEPFRTKGLGEILALGGNMFVEAMFAGMRPENATELVADAYRAPFPDFYSRVPILAFARDIPVGDDHPTAPYMAKLGGEAAQLERPTLLAWGMADRVLPPPILDAWRSLYPHAEVLELQTARHYLQEDEPEAIIGRLIEFLRTT